MPLYDFHCPACGATFEARAGMDAPAPPCESCGAGGVERLITGFASSRSPALHGAAADRSNATRRAREDQRAERIAARREARRQSGR
ncbi:zinc ribbon domain-containing protein [Conexibacter sp. DBS9H8]|uniref:FmdB family zinc ribbon protein n=1 Tax=Conexibacter sp. DBS9H8 TaxID=2937801 RepID=UPI00200D4FF8|nr:zinc ribbon domain-containing protein [Conexibacter sp. DBS9H8]